MDNIYWGNFDTIGKYDRSLFEDFAAQSTEEIRQACCDEQGKLVHLIKADHFDLSFLETICETAKAARKIAKVDFEFLKGLLKHKSVLNYFHQPSSRTFLSFSSAEAYLGMRREEVRDMKTSSAIKGESYKDALRTISSYFDALVVRHPSDYFDLFALWVMKHSDREIHIINAGSGTKEHPTQGILDYYTIQESMKRELDGMSIAYVGDCLRGRTVHSLAKIMSRHQNTTAYFVAPDHLQIDAETEKYIQQRGTIIHKETASLQDIIPLVDVIYMTRIQNEHGGAAEYDPQFIFTTSMLEEMKPGAILMHPMPKREEIDPAIDYIHKDQRVMYWRQQRNGMWVRVALLAHFFGVDEKIRKKYQEITLTL